MNQQAASFAGMLLEQEAAIDQIRLALARVAQRSPSADEIRQGLTFIQQLQSEEGLTADQALQSFCLLALNLNEFIYLD
jgi:hypothetical protein